MENKYKGNILSFFELIKKSKIEIPIIQRDYAQGREDAGEIRVNFLNALKDSIIGKKKIMLDFIYGINVEGSFQPLDGQQRLTTLFLLHWYAFKKETKPDEILKKFSYETRITSRDFCLALVENSINFDSNTKASETIIDSPWFFLSWKKDPTIDAMLRTIDDIHLNFNGIENLTEKLISEENIQFYSVDLENIGLTDDLYIKMNARGKLLTSFENFKASFQKTISQGRWENDVKDSDNLFAYKIDTCWKDLFWNKFKKNNKIDEALIRFISTIAMIRQSTNREDRGEDRLSTINKLHEDPNNVKAKYFLRSDFEYLVECLGMYERRLDEIEKIKLDFPFWRHKSAETFLKAVVHEEGGASYTQKVLFFAQTEYFRNVEIIENDKYFDWMRVVRNIVSRGDIEKSGKRPDIIRSQQTFDGVINLISELSNECADIMSYLSSDVSLKSTFAKDQVEEEKTKANLIKSNPDLKIDIHGVEDTDLLRGRIDFIFYCIDYDKHTSSFNHKLFRDIKAVINLFLNDTTVSNDLRRALLSIEVDNVYEFYSYWWSSWNVIKSDKRCLIEKFREIEYFIYSDEKEYFKKLILKLAEGQSLTDIANCFDAPDGFPNWKKRLIKEPKLLDVNWESHYIAIPEDNSCCYLLKSQRPRDEKGCEKIV